MLIHTYACTFMAISMYIMIIYVVGYAKSITIHN